jgi:hypothetical protein
MQSISSEMEAKLSEDRDKEIQFLQKLQSTIQQAKQELNNDLTRLAIKNMPLMMTSSNQERSTSQERHLGTGSQLSASSIDSDGLDTNKEHELETLDLEI